MEPIKVEVHKRQVSRYAVKLDKFDWEFSQEEATELYSALADALGKAKINPLSCNDRMSHGPHAEVIKGEIRYCNGRRFDAT